MYHAALSQDHWNQLTFIEQMGNIASEIARMVRWKTIDQDKYSRAFMRALELIDLTRSDTRWETPRLKELSRFRELLVCAAMDQALYKTTLKDFERYSYQFALAARLSK